MSKDYRVLGYLWKEAVKNCFIKNLPQYTLYLNFTISRTPFESLESNLYTISTFQYNWNYVQLELLCLDIGGPRYGETSYYSYIGPSYIKHSYGGAKVTNIQNPN